MVARDRLNSVLDKLGKGAPVAVPDSDSAQDVLTGLLRAIDETVLPRNLVVTTEADEIILQVAKRRLLSVSGAVAAELSEGDEQNLTEIGTKIARVLVGNSVALSVERPQEPADPSIIGASVAALAGAWAEATTGDSGIAEVLDRGRTSIHWQAGEEVARTGRKSVAETLEIDRHALRTLNGQRRGVLSFAAEGASEGVVFLWDGDDEAVVVFPSEDIPEIVSDWLSQ